MSEELKKSEEQVVETAAEASAQPAQAVEAVVEVPAQPEPRLAAGLFKEFKLGSTLAQGAMGNVITNLKASPIDYEAAAKNNKNEVLTAEQLEAAKKQ